MRRFLVLFDDLPIDKQAVRSGSNAKDVITACRCVNVGLFLSGNLRRDVTVSIATGTADDLKVVSFPGNTLKRVSPDERSVSFFMLKAFDIAGGLPQNSQEAMDNGMIVRREGLKQIISSYAPDRVFFAYRGSKSDLDVDYMMGDSLVIYDTESSIDSSGFEVVENNFRKLQYTPHPERLILDLNNKSDDGRRDT